MPAREGTGPARLYGKRAVKLDECPAGRYRRRVREGMQAPRTRTITVCENLGDRFINSHFALHYEQKSHIRREYWVTYTHREGDWMRIPWVGTGYMRDGG